ncbi:MAG: gliding motility-associated C-terminal domain-containing protein, partial [Bacteroidetes bacterium]|nr:gliding motility-associated C-terminal domain-containing protein [Bacteroidota bacterium]
WLWDDDFSEWIDATQLQNQSPTITPTDTNTVTLTVTLTDAFGCSATDEVTIQVFKNNAVIIPNAFSPNNDGINDIFAPVGFNIDKFDLEIYQRWGQLIHAQTGAAYGHGWDGKLPDGNRFADIGVYVYYLKVYYSNGKTATRSGNVTLVK